MWINLRTEYSFGSTYGPIDKTIQKLKNMDAKAAGIADNFGTWGHVRWNKECEKNGIKPIFGVRLAIVDRLDVKERRYPFDMVTLIALTDKGLQMIYRAVDTAHQQFYYKPLLSYFQINSLPEKDVALIGSFSPRLDLMSRHMYLELSPATPIAIRKLKNIDYIACCDNWFINNDDDDVYEPFADERKRERKTSAMHILTKEEWQDEYKKKHKALKNLNKLIKSANAKLSKADMVKFNEKADIISMCKKGAKEKDIDLGKKEYKERFEREIKLIKEKGYIDYFLVVADLIKYAKKHMLVGHSRGSSAGSLVCYLMGITEIDPLPYGLVFERFIDINRLDLPDIDVDFQDNKRHLVIKYLQKKYGKDNVAQIGNVNRLKPKSALTRFAKALKIPAWEIDEVKDAIVERSGGDARAALCITDTFHDTDVGKQFIKIYPNMMPVAKIEGHASHTGVHAAGILVCNDPITNYCGINSRNERIAMIDKKDAEAINLLKIDALGLRTLTIIADICDSVGIPYKDLYTLPLDDKEAYKVFSDQRLTGIFQFEGEAIRNLAKQMPIENIYDISALSALGRPGPLATGGATTFVNRRAGKEKVKYISRSKYVIAETEETFGVIIYQEQVMNIGRNYGGLSWEDVSELRKAMSKSLGDEFFGKYKEKFVKGAIEKGATKKDAEKVWKNMNTMGSWSFNKSHAVSYGMITYLCAYMKAHYPLEFAVASLNHAKDDKSALKLLRDLRESEGIKYKSYSEEYSQIDWSVHKGKLIAGLKTINGIGLQNARKIIANRKANTPNPPGIQKHLDILDTPFKYLYPARQIYGDYYKKPKRHGVINNNVSKINELKAKGDYCIIGMLVKKVVRDSNEAILVSKRGGQKMSGPTTYINLAFEDDTGSVLGGIGRFDFEEYGKEISESGKIDKDWYLIFGEYDPDWNKIQIANIRRITR